MIKKYNKSIHKNKEVKKIKFFSIYYIKRIFSSYEKWSYCNCFLKCDVIQFFKSMPAMSMLKLM